VAYNPFKKGTNDTLNKNDLNDLILNGVAEGFFVEYKSAFPDQKKIAKSISSFANTYGGWYFVGIETDTENKAIRLCGFDLSLVSDPLSKVRDAARHRLSHMPLMFPQLVDLDGTHSVLAIYVPEGKETPYITDDGRIYRRAADSSDPVSEKDRYTIDRLVDRGRREQERFAKFCEDDRVSSEAEDEIAWLNMYFQPHPYRLFSVETLLTNDDYIPSLLERFNSEHVILKAIPGLDFEEDNIHANGNGQEQKVTGRINFNTVYSTANSIVMRNIVPGTQAFRSPTVHIYYDGAAKFHIPLPKIRFNHESVPDLRTGTVVQILRNLVSNYGDSRFLNFSNFGETTLSFLVFTSFYIEWLNEQNYSGDLWCRVNLANCGRTVAVMDTPLWADLVESNGLPVALSDSINIPDLHEDAANFDMSASLGIGMASWAARALGIPHRRFSDMISDLMIFYGRIE
jgi:hypothetical protein